MADNNTRNQVKEITDRLEEGMKDLFTSEKYLSYLQTMSRFSKYSTRNTLLIHMQMPDASLVAGYQSWQSKFGRHVKRGEKGIKILAPTPFTIKKEEYKLDPDTRTPVYGADGLPLTEEIEIRIPRFKIIPVFDVSQTDGKPLPNLVENLTGDVRHFTLFMDALKEVSPLPIDFEPLDPGTDGLCRMGKNIAIREGMSEVQTVSAVIHEITHAVLHDSTLEQIAAEAEQDAPAKKPKDRRTEEVEAESVSYAVCQYYGIETAPNSFGYLAEWSKTRELKELSASLDTIRKTAATLIDGIDEKYRALAKERGIDLTGEQRDAAPNSVPELREENRRFIVIPDGGAYFIRDTVSDTFHGENGLVVRYTEEAAANEVAATLNSEGLQATPPAQESPAAATEPETPAAPVPPTPELASNQHIENIGGVEFVFTSAHPAPAPTPPPKPEKQYELGFGHMGNGITVWNRLEEKNGDYATVAHIDPDRTVSFYDKDMPTPVRVKIQSFAHTAEMTVSATQDTPVFSTPPIADTPEHDAPQAVEPEPPADTPDTAPQNEQEQDCEYLPDPAIGLSERDLFGYTDNAMLPLTQDRALELFDADHTVYLLYPDNTEGMAFERAEIEAHDGIFGIEAEEWEASREFAAMKAAVENSEASKEAALIYGKDNTFGIYQLKGGDDLHYHRFTALDQLEKDGLTIDRANYELVYTAPLDIRDTQTNLHKIYETFNIARPEDFTGHSLSVSDIIVLQWRGNVRSHYVDNDGFKELPAFLGNEKLPEAASPVQQETTGPTVAELEAQAKAGKQISLTDLARAVKNERNQSVNKGKPSILAQLQESKKAVSQGREPQNNAPKRDKEREV